MLGVSRLIRDPSGQVVWAELGRGLPNAPVNDLHYYQGSNLLLAGTFGRGAWTASVDRAGLSGRSVLRIEGTADADRVELARPESAPWMLRVIVNGGQTKNYQLSTIERVVFDGKNGNDELIVHSSNGLIGVANGIHFIGGNDNDTIRLEGPAGLQHTRRQPSGTNGTGSVTSVALKDSLGTVVTQAITFESMEVLDNRHENVRSKRLTVLGRGTASATASLSTKLDQPDLLAKNIPPAGNGIAQAVSGAKRTVTPKGIADLRAEVAATAEADVPTEGGETPFLRRLFETGLGALPLAEISEDGQISTPALLRDALDALDDTPNNVSFEELGVGTPSEDDDVLVFDVEIKKKSLSGPADLAIAAEALGGTVELDGTLEISADLTLDLRLGVDSAGFYLEPLAGSAPEIVFDHIRTNGRTEAQGQLGFLGVTLTDAVLAMDPAVRIAVKLSDPGTDAADGKIRLTELEADAAALAVATVTGNPTADDVVLTGDVRVAAFGSSEEPAFDLGEASITLRWADIANPAGVTIEATAGAAQEFLGFLRRSADDVLDGLESLATTLQQSAGTDLLATNLPILNKSLGEVLNGVGAPINLARESVSLISTLEGDGQFGRFAVYLAETNLSARGIATGDAVFFDTAGGEREGTIESVGPSEFTVRFAASAAEEPLGDVRVPHRPVRVAATRDRSVSRRPRTAAESARTRPDAARARRGAGEPGRTGHRGARVCV